MTDFFRINMPYGMVKNSKGEWCFFNREYTYLGSIECGKYKMILHSLPIYRYYR